MDSIVYKKFLSVQVGKNAHNMIQQSIKYQKNDSKSIIMTFAESCKVHLAIIWTLRVKMKINT